MTKENEKCNCDPVEDYETPNVGCPFHGQEALKNKTGYYKPKPDQECLINKLKVYYEPSKNFTLGETLLFGMKKLIDNGTWQWGIKPKKESWLNKHFGSIKKLNCLLP